MSLKDNVEMPRITYIQNSEASSLHTRSYNIGNMNRDLMFKCNGLNDIFKLNTNVRKGRIGQTSS